MNTDVISSSVAKSERDSFKLNLAVGPHVNVPFRLSRKAALQLLGEIFAALSPDSGDRMKPAEERHAR